MTETNTIYLLIYNIRHKKQTTTTIITSTPHSLSIQPVSTTPTATATPPSGRGGSIGDIPPTPPIPRTQNHNGGIDFIRVLQFLPSGAGHVTEQLAGAVRERLIKGCAFGTPLDPFIPRHHFLHQIQRPLSIVRRFEANLTSPTV